MADALTDVYGLPSGGFDYGMGSGWLPYLNQQDQMLASLYLGQAGLGQGLLGTLQNLLTSPTGGPLGLAATAKFGNPNGIAAGTGGKGIDTSQYTGLFDSLLKGLGQSVMNPGSPFNPANNGQYNTSAAKIDPNNAPAPNPENAAKAPNAAQDMIDAYKAYHNGQMPPGMIGGGLLSLVPGYADGGLMALDQAATKAGYTSPEQRQQFTNTLRSIQYMGNYIRGLSRGSTDDQNWLMKQLSTLHDNAGIPNEMQGIGPNGPVLQNYLGPKASIDDVTTWDPRMINQVLAQRFNILPKQSYYGGIVPDQPDFLQNILQRKSGGGVTIGGEPHFVVDSKGKPVAALTEDGKPEHVAGVGGVEVTPLDPMRNALYEARKKAAQKSARTISDMEGEVKSQMPAYATGGDLLFPYYPGSKVNTGDTTNPGSQTMELPTFGGPTDTGKTTGYKPTGGNSFDDFMSSINDIPGASYNERYAKMLGGALGSNALLGADQINPLNAGRAPDKLFSATQLASMAPGQRQAYASMLQQMGIIQSPADLNYYVKQFTPDALG